MQLFRLVLPGEGKTMSASDQAGDGSSEQSDDVARSNLPFSPRPKPEAISDYDELDAPIVRIASKRGHCRLVGKAFNHSTLFWDVVSIAGEGLVTRRIAKAKAHIVRCAECPAEV
jgi:hypothetical protein